MDNQLPAEVRECIDNWIVTFALAYHKSDNKDISNDAAEYLCDELNMPNALTEYATKLQEAEQERDQAKNDFERVQKSAIHYANRKDEVEKKRDELRTKCDRYEAALKRVQDVCQHDNFDHKSNYCPLCIANEALSAGEEIEFCYRYPDGRVEVRYRRIEGTPECEAMIKEVDGLIEKAKPELSPYFYRKANQKDDQQ